MTVAGHGGRGAAEAGACPAELGQAILAGALVLAGRVLSYDADPVRRWSADRADCSSFVQRVLCGAGVVACEPGPGHRNAWSARAFATRDDVFVTVGAAEACPGDVLVQGGFVTAADGVTRWKAHCGVFRQRAHPGLLHGVSMGRRGPVVNGVWGAAPPRGHYPFGAGLLVRRLRSCEPTAAEAGPTLPPSASRGRGERQRAVTW
ncbi:hypothetical protein [Catenuloplanes japonicus]|uniref:hypothetical protein n=1 Tax=Catenuloplanes japonicus TaxID=33876 RepID=UPI0012F83566|nr:hypothetical protein [Catenuloplanes japonicus]